MAKPAAKNGLLRWLSLLLFLAAPSFAVVEIREFDNEVTRKRYQVLIDELRCPKCQNQNLAGSDSPIATDLRRELRRLLEDGRSDGEIIDFMVARYGEYVLYRPRLSNSTVVLWTLPVVLLVVGLLIIGIMVKRRSGPKAVAEVSKSESERLRQLLARAESMAESSEVDVKERR